MSGLKYTKEEEEILRELWEKCPNVKTILEYFPNRSHAALALKAANMGLKAYPRHRRSDLTKLLDDTVSNWYWYGFILADGYFSDRGELSITINEVDSDHLSLLADHVGAKVKYLKKTATQTGSERRHVRLAAMNLNVTNKLKEKLGLTLSRKTENPPNTTVFEHVDKKLLTALFIGFFDGDGSMRDKGYGSIGCHVAWIDVLRLFEDLGLVKNIRVDKFAYCTIPVAVASKLKNFPVHKLERKWSKAR